jgi:soluble lytic murein transglycosylase-like protein
MAASRCAPRVVFCARLLVWATALSLVHASPSAGETPGATAPDAAPDLVAKAIALEHGEGVPKDPLTAAALYCVAARAGNPEAQYNLGWMYANGRGVARDDAAASAFFALAAKNGHEYAQKMLTRLGSSAGELPECMRPPERPPALAALEEPDPFVDLPPQRKKIAELVEQVAPRYGIEPRFALAVIAVESNFEPLARSGKDARGLMQLIPQTAARFNVRNPFSITDNVRGGLAYLRWLLAYYQGQVALAAAAYNAGEAAVDRYRGVPPFPETRDYVKRVQRFFPRELHPYDAGVVAPSPIFVDAKPRPM